MELTYSAHRGYHYSVCQKCGNQHCEKIPDQAPDEYQDNPGNPVMAICPNCNHGVGTGRIILDGKVSHKAQESGDCDSEALSYDRLPEPWREWAKLARNLVYREDYPDKEDLMHDIIVSLFEVADKYRKQGRTLTKWGCIRAAQYTRLHFYHQRTRWKKLSSVSLNSVIEDEDGYETELVETIPYGEGVDLDTWIDAKTHFKNSSEKTRRAIWKLLNGERLSGYDHKLLKRFRVEFAETR